MDSNTTYTPSGNWLYGDRNGHFPHVTPIRTSNLRLCCGPSINSAATQTLRIPYINNAGRTYFKGKYITTGQCQLVSGTSQQSESIRPAQISTWCSIDQPPFGSCK
eukprot:733879_1